MVKVPMEESGMVSADEYEILAAEDFKEFHESANWKNAEGESIAGYRRKTAFWTGEKLVARLKPNHFEGTRSSIDNFSKMDMVFHSHPNYAYPSNTDYITSNYLNRTYKINSYLLAPNNRDFYLISSKNRQFFRLSY